MHFLESSLLFISIISVAILSGLGVLQCCGLRRFQQRLLIAPTIAIATTAILVALVVILGIPIEVASPIIWLFWLVSATFGAPYLRAALLDLEHRSVLWIAALGTSIVLGGFLWYGFLDYLGSPALDGWSYVSFGEYLRHYPKGTEGGLQPIYQYAAHLSGTRYVASAMLAALVPPWAADVDTQMTVGVLLALSVYSFAVSIGYVCVVMKQRGMNAPPFVAVMLGAVGGWVPYALHMNNYDNILALPLAPVLFGVSRDQTLSSRGRVLLASVFMAASIYIYPELSPLIIGVYVIVGLEDLLTNRRIQSSTRQADVLLKYLATGFIALVLASPYLVDAARFFVQQLSSTAAVTGRPGEGFMPSLLDAGRIWGAMWALPSMRLTSIVGVCLTLVAIYGAYAVTGRNNASIVAYLLLAAILFALMVVWKRYDYGAYKVLLISWWAVVVVLAMGATRLWESASGRNTIVNRLSKVAISLLLLAATSLWLRQQYRWVNAYSHKTAIPTREARNFVLNSKAAVQVSVSDPILNAWLVYQLRNCGALFMEFHGYIDQPHVQPLMHRSARPPEADVKYALTERHRPTLGKVVWSDEALKITKSTYVPWLP